MKKTIYIFGNPLMKEDSLPIELIPELQKKFPDIDFKHIDPNENLKPANGEITVIDTAVNIDKVMVIDDFEMLDSSPNYSMHDFDLAFNLKLLKKIGKLKRMTIFAIPPGPDKKKDPH